VQAAAVLAQFLADVLHRLPGEVAAAGVQQAPAQPVGHIAGHPQHVVEGGHAVHRPGQLQEEGRTRGLVLGGPVQVEPAGLDHVGGAEHPRRPLLGAHVAVEDAVLAVLQAGALQGVHQRIGGKDMPLRRGHVDGDDLVLQAGGVDVHLGAGGQLRLGAGRLRPGVLPAQGGQVGAVTHRILGRRCRLRCRFGGPGSRAGRRGRLRLRLGAAADARCGCGGLRRLGGAGCMRGLPAGGGRRGRAAANRFRFRLIETGGTGLIVQAQARLRLIGPIQIGVEPGGLPALALPAGRRGLVGFALAPRGLDDDVEAVVAPHGAVHVVEGRAEVLAAGVFLVLPAPPGVNARDEQQAENDQ